MKRILLALVALVLVSGNAVADKVRIGTEGAYPPL